MTFPAKFGLYGILTDPPMGYEQLAAMMVSQGVRIVQLRMKSAAKSEVVHVGRALKQITAGSETLLMVNDSPEIALEIGADGVHLGQEDTPYEQAREILGPGAIIGLSTHSVSQARAACALAPDYIAMGPVFATSTKQNPDPVIGLSGLKEILRIATVPTVAIGGIRLSNVTRVLDTGIFNVACIGCISEAQDPAHSLKQLLGVIKRHHAARV